MGHHLHRPPEAPERLPPGVGDHSRPRALSVLSRSRGDDAARGAGISHRRQRAEHAGLERPRGPEQVPGAAGRGQSRSPGRGHVRPHERHRRARGDHRDAGSRSAAGDDVRAGNRAGVLGVPRAHAGPEARFPAALHPDLQESRCSGGRDAGASALAADRAADRAGTGAPGDRRGAAALRSSRNAASSATSCTRSSETAGG